MSRTHRMSAGLVAVTAAAALTMVGCGGSSGSSSGGGAGDIKGGLITKTETNPFFVKMKEGAEKEAKGKGATPQSAAGKFQGANTTPGTPIEKMVASGGKGN